MVTPYNYTSKRFYNRSFAKKIADATGFRLDEGTGMLHGQRGMFPVILSLGMNDNNYSIHFSIGRSGQSPDQATLKEAHKECRTLTGKVEVQGYHVRFLVKAGMKSLEKLLEALDFLPAFLIRAGYEPCCEGCGQPLETSSYNIKGVPAQLCAPCFSARSNQVTQAQIMEANKQENVIGGVVGALLGALIGGLAIVIIARLGYVAWISGVIMGACALQGYRMLGGKLTTKGIVISVIIMAVVVYFANRVGVALELQAAVSKEFGARARAEFGFFDAFKMIPSLAKSEPEIGRIYHTNLILNYVFTLLGAAPTVIQTIRERGLQAMAVRI